MRQLKITPSITNRESDLLDKYLREIGREELITMEEEIILAKKIKNGDQAALDKLTKANLRFVVSVAKKYQNQGLSLPDLINEGNLGLIKAAQRFDETKGFKFISYAVWWIRQSILRALNEQSRMVRLPINQIGFIHKISKTFLKLEQGYEREPSVEEIALMLKIPESEVKKSTKIKTRHVSIDAPYLSTNHEVLDMCDFMPNGGPSPESNLLHESLQCEIERSLSTLVERERDIVKLFFGLGLNYGLSLEEIGSKFDLTRERVRQILKKAIKRLKRSWRTKILKTYLG